MDERRFSDEEVREILKKAVEKRPSRSLVKAEGLSLAELKTIGGEVGIDPDRLEDAARAVVLRGENRPSGLLGAPTVLHFERKVSGDLDPEDTPNVLSLIRRTMGSQGEVDEIHGALEWSAKGDSGERCITLSSREGTTTITGSANLTNAAVLTYLPPGIVGVISAIVGLIETVESGSLVGVVFFLALVPVLFGVLRTILNKFVGSEAKKLEHTVEELARLTEGSQEGE
jgi:hypothetical protein